MVKHILLVVMLLFGCTAGRGQYFAMPTDSATWRYRIYDIDGSLTHVFDILMLQNGKDTVAGGHTYRQIVSRTQETTGATYFNPPLVTTVAGNPDIYFGAIREDSQKVYQLNHDGSESLMYNFSALPGDYVPAFTGTVMVTSIDSVLLNDGLYHRSFHTTDTTYTIIEGAGSNRGLYPDYNNGSGIVMFYCFNHNVLTYLPDTTYPCTYIYPSSYGGLNVSQTDATSPNEFSLAPNPAVNEVTFKARRLERVSVTNCVGVQLFSEVFQGQFFLNVSDWPRGVYFVHFSSEDGAGGVMKMVVL